MRARPEKWWLANRNGLKPHEALHSTLDSISTFQSVRRTRALRNARMMHADLAAFGVDLTKNEQDFDYFSFNRLYSGARSIASKVTSSRVMPFAATEGGSWEERQKADEFNRAVVGLLEDQEVYSTDFAWAMDALTFDAAVAKVSKRHGEVCIDRVFAFDITVDPYEARYGKRGIRSLYHRYLIDREQLLGLFPDIDEETKGKVLTAGIEGEDDKRMYKGSQACDLVLLTEAWHLESAPGAGDGRYVVALRNCTLADEEYTAEGFPFAFMHQIPPQFGIWSEAYAERHSNEQATLDKLCDTMADSVDVASKLRILKKSGTEITEIDDENAKIYEYQGAEPPIEWTMTPFHPASFQYMQWLSEGMVSTEGISEMSASGSLPQGLRGASGKALVVADDTFSEQLAPFMHSRQAFYCKLGELALDAARDLAAENDGYLISVVDGRNIRRVRFKDIDLGEGNYRLVVQPASYLSKSPAAKYQQLSEMRANGDISPIEFRRLMGVPDLLAVNELDTSMLDVVDKTIDGILSKGKQAVAFPFDNFDLIIERGTKALHLARLRDEEDPERISALLEYVRSAFDERNRQQAPPSPAPPMPGAPMPPPGPPMGPPPDGMAPPMNGAPPMPPGGMPIAA